MNAENEENGAVLGPVGVDVVPVLAVDGLRTREEQAAFYGVAVRTIGYWRAKGAPVGRPAEMAAWWARTFPEKPTNRGILVAVGKLPVLGLAGAGVTGPGVTGTGVERPASEPEPDLEGEAVEEGVDATLGRLAGEEARLFRRMKALERAGRHDAAEALRPGWQRMAAALGDASNQQQRLMQRRGDLVSLALVQREYALLLVNHPEILRAGIKKLRLLLQPTPPAHEWDVQVDRLVDDLFRGMPRELMGRAEEAIAAA